jgi:PAB-dependent poly(A)-specific ribonuclease subunit 3
LTNEKAIRSVKEWRRVDSAGVVTVHDAFTTRAFGDSSLIFVTDYHPLSKTLMEHHFTRNRAAAVIPEQVLWGYVVQIALALKDIHAAGLAARCLEPSKVILTDKNRIRLNACSVLDVVQYESQRPLIELQQEDFMGFGKLILSVATNNVSSGVNLKVALDQLSRNYTVELRDTLIWLLTPAVRPPCVV